MCFLARKIQIQPVAEKEMAACICPCSALTLPSEMWEGTHAAHILDVNSHFSDGACGRLRVAALPQTSLYLLYFYSQTCCYEREQRQMVRRKTSSVCQCSQVNKGKRNYILTHVRTTIQILYRCLSDIKIYTPLMLVFIHIGLMSQSYSSMDLWKCACVMKQKV